MANLLRFIPLLLILCSAPPLVAQDAALTLKPLNQRGVVRLKTIASDFAANGPAAIAKYSGRRITVIGRIARFSQGEGENIILVVSLKDAASSLPAVKCKFLPGTLPEHSEIQISQDGSNATLIRRDSRGIILSQNTYLSADELVAIKGDYKGLNVGDIVFTNCKILPKERLHELRDDLKKDQG